MPLIELLLLLLLLLRTALLHRRRGADQRMRLLRSRPFLLLRRPELAVRRLVAILRLLRIPVLGLRSSLLLVRPWLRLRHSPDLIITPIVAGVVPIVGRSEGLEALLRLRRRLCVPLPPTRPRTPGRRLLPSLSRPR